MTSRCGSSWRARARRWCSIRARSCSTPRRADPGPTSIKPKCKFARLERPALERYLEIEQPYDCVGSFKAEALGVALFERIDSRDPTALIGLPLIWLAARAQVRGDRRSRPSAAPSSAPAIASKTSLSSCGSGTLDRELLARLGPDERHRVRVQEHAPQAEAFERRVELLVAVALVARDRVAEMRGMHADLMRAPGRRSRPRAATRPCRPLRSSGTSSSLPSPSVATLHARFAADRASSRAAPTTSATALPPAPLDEREIALVDSSFAQQRVHGAQRAAPFRDAASSPKSRDRAGERARAPAARAAAPQRLDAAERDAACRRARRGPRVCRARAAACPRTRRAPRANRGRRRSDWLAPPGASRPAERGRGRRP